MAKRDRTPRVRLISSPSRFDRSPRSLLLAVRVYVTRANLVLLTEVGRDPRSRILRTLPGWGVAHDNRGGGRDDCAVLYRRRAWPEVRFRTKRLTDLPTSDRGSHRTFLLVVDLAHRTGFRAKVAHAHLPAHVETHLVRFRTLGRAGIPASNLVDLDAWHDAQRTYAGLARRWATAVRRGRFDGLILSADWNVNLRVPYYRLAARAGFPGELAWNWTKPYPTRGTHHRRIIDGHLTDLPDQTEPFPDDASSDHSPYRSVLRLARSALRAARRVTA